MLNEVRLIGNLGQDPELRYTANGISVCNFSVATTETFKDKQGEKQEKVEWHNITAWGNLAEICGKYLQKGKQVFIGGSIQTSSYDDKDGNKRHKTEIVARDMKMLGSASDRPSSGGTTEPTQPKFNPDDDIPFALPLMYFSDPL